MDIQQICNYIILISAVLIALKNIYEFVAKPTSKFKSKHQKAIEEKIGEVVEQKMVSALTAYEEGARAKQEQRNAEVKRVIKSEIVDEIKPILDEILAQNTAQNKQIDILTISSKDMLRQRIMAIYHANRMDRTLTETEAEILNELYKDYKAQKGNSYIDKYYNRMKTWEIIADDYEE